MSIVLQDLYKEFGAHTVVDHVSLEVHDGELFVLLGPSGSGKSTILRLIAGLIPADSGSIWLNGRDVTNLTPQERNTGFVFQNYSLFRHMTVADNIEFGLAARKVPQAQRVAKREELLSLVGLGGLGKRYPKQLSGGQQQRVAVARALAFEPSVLLLDEPFGALDVKIREQLRRALKEIQSKLHVTTILVTHDQEEAFELADRIGVINQGKLHEVGPPAALYRSPQHEFVATFLGGANLLAGQVEHGRVNLGAMELSDAVSYTTVDPEGRLEVLFRPEDLTLATEREELTVPVLGQGVVEEVLLLGTLQRVRLRLQPLPGTWRLPMEYGESGVPIQVSRIPRHDRHLDFQIGQQVWVGINNFHILPRVPIRLLLCVEDQPQLDPFFNFGTMLAHATGGPVTALAVAEEKSAADRLRARPGEALAPRMAQLECKTRQGRVADEMLDEMGEGIYDLALAADGIEQAAISAEGGDGDARVGATRADPGAGGEGRAQCNTADAVLHRRRRAGQAGYCFWRAVGAAHGRSNDIAVRGWGDGSRGGFTAACAGQATAPVDRAPFGGRSADVEQSGYYDAGAGTRGYCGGGNSEGSGGRGLRSNRSRRASRCDGLPL